MLMLKTESFKQSFNLMWHVKEGNLVGELNKSNFTYMIETGTILGYL